MYTWFKNMTEEDIIPEFRLKNIDETKNYFFKKIEQNDWWGKSIKRFVQL